MDLTMKELASAILRDDAPKEAQEFVDEYSIATRWRDYKKDD